ncbi:hypothetical protein [Isoptericola variabilis]|uniref:hypothetical protein n=1 Tax=Isoptericola variabilis TaxID=139208 RepID=UPI0002FAA468|nr:hypothetical protein [Isoptericola variabilis]TWH33947.1 hypothetical protein L600_001400000030 [Isoptericola variabilis J7]
MLKEAEIPLAVAAGSALAAAPETWSADVPTLEDLGVDQGVAIHTTVLHGPREALPLQVTGVADRVTVYVDGRLAVAGPGPVVSVDLPAIPAGGSLRVDLVVESLGRVNYGPLVGERKGITGQVRDRLRAAPVRRVSTRRPWDNEGRRPGPADAQGYVVCNPETPDSSALPWPSPSSSCWGRRGAPRRPRTSRCGRRRPPSRRSRCVSPSRTRSCWTPPTRRS